MDTESITTAILELIDSEPIHHESWVQKSYLRNEIANLIQEYTDEVIREYGAE